MLMDDIKLLIMFISINTISFQISQHIPNLIKFQLCTHTSIVLCILRYSGFKLNRYDNFYILLKYGLINGDMVTEMEVCGR